MESGSTVGAHTICTQLRHWSEGRPATFVPDVQGNLSRVKSEAVRKDSTGTPWTGRHGTAQGGVATPTADSIRSTMSTCRYSTGFSTYEKQ